MAQIGASDVTYTLVEGSQRSNAADPRFSAVFSVAFGNGTLTYTGGGIPLTRAKLGCPASVSELLLINDSSNDALVYKFNNTAESIQIYTSAHLHNFIMAGGVTTTADFLYNSSGALGKAAATNVTIAGNLTASVLGGVVGAIGLSELLTTTIVSATTLRMRVVGF